MHGQTMDCLGKVCNPPRSSVSAQASWGVDVSFGVVIILGCMQSLSVSAQACPEREPMLPGQATKYSQPCLPLCSRFQHPTWEFSEFVVPA